MNYSDAHKNGTRILSAAGITEAALDARLLLEFITGQDTTAILAGPDTDLTEAEAAEYEALIAKRAERIPMGHLTGTCGFMGIDFRVSSSVLIPRQDSECLVEEAMRYTQDGSDILDLCTGSGCLLLSLMHYKNGCRGTGVDISGDALAVARENHAVLGASGGLNGGSAEFISSDLYDALTGRKFDVIISNPPYIRSEVIDTLMPEVREYEPRIALDGGSDGLEFYRRIADGALEHLRPGGMIFLEIGYDQAEDVTKILADAGFRNIETVKDYAGNDRVIAAHAALKMC